MRLKKLTIAKLRTLRPCYDPTRYAPEDWQGTALDILRHPDIPDSDKLFCVLSDIAINEKTARLLAVYFARQALNSVSLVHPDSINAINVAEKFALGLATPEELSAALSAAWSEALSAARSEALSAAEAAALSAAWSAARSAAWSAARSAALGSEALSAEALSAARSAALGSEALSAEALSAVEAAQVQHIQDRLETNNERYLKVTDNG